MLSIWKLSVFRHVEREKKAAGILLGALGLLIAGGPAYAADPLPVPAIVIYPGDTIKDQMLVDRDYPEDSPVRGSAIGSHAALVGKIARRTLLPGLPIPINAVGSPDAVTNGAKVRVIFEQDGLVIETYAAALQSGGVGQVISVRNLDSGITISGIVQSDGSVRVGG
ncbi:MAG TPA: flagellar basal body P-ring formation chaperone FlgA [Methylovirgula sp.]|nr:flagellar basal body P-ring formation chaperone FlgA [Methylovirgula sp.]